MDTPKLVWQCDYTTHNSIHILKKVLNKQRPLPHLRASNIEVIEFHRQSWRTSIIATASYSIILMVSLALTFLKFTFFAEHGAKLSFGLLILIAYTGFNMLFDHRQMTKLARPHSR